MSCCGRRATNRQGRLPQHPYCHVGLPRLQYASLRETYAVAVPSMRMPSPTRGGITPQDTRGEGTRTVGWPTIPVSRHCVLATALLSAGDPLERVDRVFACPGLTCWRTASP